MVILNPLKMWLPSDQPISLLRLYSKEVITRRGDKNVRNRVFTTMLFMYNSKRKWNENKDCLNTVRYKQ